MTGDLRDDLYYPLHGPDEQRRQYELGHEVILSAFEWHGITTANGGYDPASGHQRMADLRLHEACEALRRHDHRKEVKQ